MKSTFSPGQRDNLVHCIIHYNQHTVIIPFTGAPRGPYKDHVPIIFNISGTKDMSTYPTQFHVKIPRQTAQYQMFQY